MIILGYNDNNNNSNHQVNCLKTAGRHYKHPRYRCPRCFRSRNQLLEDPLDMAHPRTRHH